MGFLDWNNYPGGRDADYESEDSAMEEQNFNDPIGSPAEDNARRQGAIIIGGVTNSEHFFNSLKR